jgi:SsrA-binding protein
MVPSKLLIKNRKALFNYEIIEKYVAGIVLRGYEAKALKEGKVSFEGSYIDIKDKKPYILNLQIGRYSKQGKSIRDYEENRPKELLLNKIEIQQIRRELAEKGKTAVPLALILQNGMVKLEMATVKGKKEFEKKQVAKDKQIKKDLEREVKSVF